MTTIAALGWVLGALWGAPTYDEAPLRVTGFYEAQGPVSHQAVVVTPAGECVARRWAL